MAAKKKAAKKKTKKAERKKAPDRANTWTKAHTDFVSTLYLNPKMFSMTEITYRFNRKFPDVQRNTAAVSQRIVALRRGGAKLPLRGKTSGPGYLSEAAIEFMVKLDAKHAATKAARKAEKDTPRRGFKARAETNGGNGHVETRKFHVDLGSKGSISMEISGPVVLDTELMSNLSSAMTRALSV